MGTTPDKVEVKFAVAPQDTIRAMKALGLPDAADEEYVVHFFDTKPVSLLGKGLILRARQRSSGGGEDDSTCKLREEGAAEAAEKFGVDKDMGRKFEGDQNVGGEERPSYSITLKPPPVPVADVLGGATILSRLFGREANFFLYKLGGAWNKLLHYGPIQARKWELEPKGFDKKVTVELWKAGDVELLEVSDKKDRDKADHFSKTLKKYMTEELGVAQLLDKTGAPASKTEFALRNVQPSRLSR